MQIVSFGLLKEKSELSYTIAYEKNFKIKPRKIMTNFEKNLIS